jgi:hypothetical protein
MAKTDQPCPKTSRYQSLLRQAVAPRPAKTVPQPEIAGKSAKTARLITGGRFSGMAMDLCVGWYIQLLFLVRWLNDHRGIIDRRFGAVFSL